MASYHIIVCPNLKGSAEGAQCNMANGFIKDHKDTDIKICMSRHYESCPLYLCGLLALTKRSKPAEAHLEKTDC
ncbi:MAG: hypothetical protein AB1553_00855 [Nitrospirota bacterium]